MNWKYATDPMLVKYFEHENVHSKKWQRLKGCDVLVTLPDSDQEELLAVYEATFNGIQKQFAHGEISNGIYVFYIPAL